MRPFPPQTIAALLALASLFSQLGSANPKPAPSPSPSPSPGVQASKPTPPPPPAKRPPPPPAVQKQPGALARLRKVIYFDLFGYGGYSSVAVTQAANPVTLLHFGAGFTAAIHLLDLSTDAPTTSLFVGWQTDYRKVNQMSDVDPAYGNLRGTRFDLFAPTLCLRYDNWLVAKVDLQLTGRYNLSNPTADGGSVSYGKPFGFGLAALYGLKTSHSPGAPRNFFIGIEVEHTQFGTQQYSGSPEVNLDNPFVFLQGGLTFAWAL